MLREFPSRLITVLLVVAPLIGCHLQVDSQVILAVHDVEDDRLEFVFVHRGIMARSQKDVVKARREITPLIQGARTFGFGWPFYLELDKLAPKWSEADRALAAGVSLMEHGLFLDDQGRLSGFQYVEVRSLKAVVSRVNEVINAGILVQAELNEASRDAENYGSDGDKSEGDPVNEDDFLLTAERWIAAAKEDWTWIIFSDARFVIRFPFDHAEMDAKSRALAEFSEEPGIYGSLENGLGASFSSEFKDDVYTLTFVPDEQGILSMNSGGHSESEWSAELMESLPSLTQLGIRERMSPEMLRALLLGD